MCVGGGGGGWHMTPHGTALYHTIPHHATSKHSTPHCTKPHIAPLSNTSTAQHTILQYSTVHYSTVQLSTVAVPCYSVLHCTALCRAVPCWNVLCCTAQCTDTDAAVAAVGAVGEAVAAALLFAGAGATATAAAAAAQVLAMVATSSETTEEEEDPYPPPLPRGDSLDKEVFKLWLPAMLNMAVVPLVGAVDVFWVGQMGDVVALASQGAANQVSIALTTPNHAHFSHRHNYCNRPPPQSLAVLLPNAFMSARDPEGCVSMCHGALGHVCPPPPPCARMAVSKHHRPMLPPFF